jgi:hypothetical protein
MKNLLWSAALCASSMSCFLSSAHADTNCDLRVSYPIWSLGQLSEQAHVGKSINGYQIVYSEAMTGAFDLTVQTLPAVRTDGTFNDNVSCGATKVGSGYKVKNGFLIELTHNSGFTVSATFCGATGYIPAKTIIAPSNQEIIDRAKREAKTVAEYTKIMAAYRSDLDKLVPAVEAKSFLEAALHALPSCKTVLGNP